MTSTANDRIRALTGTLGVKAPCLLATTANITLSGEQTIDGTLTSEDRVLVKNQTTASQNGIYDTGTGAWTRAADFDGDRDVAQGTLVPVASGTVNAGSVWRLTTADPVIDTSSLTFAVWVSPFAQTLTDGATVAWDVSKGTMGILTLGGNRTVAAPTNMRNGEAYALILNQDATGSRTVTWNAVFKWPGGTAPALSTPSGSKDIFSFLSDGTNLYGVAQKAFS